MLKVIFTLDYEIHGNGEGCPYALMVEPTQRLLRQLERAGAKLTIMADVAEILKFRDYAREQGQDDCHYADVAEQLRQAIQRGHDVQLHLHSSYFNARWERGRWAQDWSEYNFAGLGPDRLKQVVRQGKEFLEEMLQPVNARYQCNVFRAANWSMSPSRNVVRALVDNGIRIDTSVFKYGQREGLVNFDYRSAWSQLVPWPVNENDICERDERGELLEFPIYAENRWLGAFLTPQRVYRAWVSRRHRFAGAGQSAAAPAETAPPAVPRSRRPSRHAWKADFNQCSGRQLARALGRAERAHSGAEVDLPFVLIGHSKLFTRFNEWSLQPFLRHVAERPAQFGFGRFADFLEPARRFAHGKPAICAY